MSYQQILDLASSDGWLAVYDPTNPSTRTVSSGRVTRLADGLGNLPELTGSSTAPELQSGAFGALDGLAGLGGTVERYLSGTFGRTVSQPNTVFALGRRLNAASTPSARFLWNGTSTNARQAVFVSGASGNPVRFLAAESTDDAQGGVPVDDDAALYCASFTGRQSELISNGQSLRYGLGDVNTHGLNGLILGGAHNGFHWSGSFGLVMIYEGELSWAAGNRMRDLIHGTTGIPYNQPRYAGGSRVITVSGSGEVTTRRSAVETPNATGIASMTKMLTSVVARKYLTTNALLDTRAEVTEADIWSLSGDRFKPGDLVRCRDLIYSMAAVSDNTAPRTLARHVGDLIPGSGDPYQRFLQEMRDEAASRDWSEFTVTQPGGGARLSPTHVTELVREISADSFLQEAFSTDPYDVDITGSDPRTETLQLAPNSSHAYWMPEFITGKGGTNAGVTHYAAVWRHPIDRTEYATVIMDIPQGVDRYQFLRRAMVVSITGTGLGFPESGPTRIGMRVQDYARQGLPNVEVFFHPVGMSSSPPRADVLVDNPVSVDTGGSDRYFYVELEPNHRYQVEVRWTNATGTSMETDWWHREIIVPVEGEDDDILLPDVMELDPRPGMVRILQSDPGPNTLDRYVYNESTGDLFERTV